MHDLTEQLALQPRPSRFLDARTADALRRLIQMVSQSHSSVPLGKLVNSSQNLGQWSLEIDVAAARLIGIPVVVLRDRRPSMSQPVFQKLSAREREVARLVAAGHDNAGISRKLGISIGTVKDHVHHALTKTGMRSRTALAAALAREGV